MPLHAYNKSPESIFQCFNDAIRRRGNSLKVFAYFSS